MVWPTLNSKHEGRALVAPAPPAPPPPPPPPPNDLIVSIVPGTGSDFSRPTTGDIVVVWQAYVSGGSGDYTINYFNQPATMHVEFGAPLPTTTFVAASATDNVTGHTGDSGTITYTGHAP